ncbi:MAG TPA: CBS domain-containing protein [Flavitalea sp.]|nr:CBS domain-containing protein [Flavitalea sp.]
MLNKELISPSIPTLTLNDTVYQAMELMSEFHLSQLPVVTEDQYLGLVFESDLLSKDESQELSSMVESFSKVSVHAQTHMIESIQAAIDYSLSVIPVIEKNNEFIGVILSTDLLKNLGRMTGAGEPGGLIVLEMEERNFSFAEISKLVETNDAQITQLNSYWDSTTDSFLVTIKINKFEISDIIATFQRYEYQVKYYFGEELYENELRDNYDHLMTYLNI